MRQLRAAVRPADESSACGVNYWAMRSSKLLIALWRYVDHGELPEGAQEKDWRLRVDSTARRHAKAAALA